MSFVGWPNGPCRLQQQGYAAVDTNCTCLALMAPLGTFQCSECTASKIAHTASFYASVWDHGGHGQRVLNVTSQAILYGRTFECRNTGPSDQ